jgi:valacyclovir hydrolase
MPYFIHDQHRFHYCEQGTGPLLLVLPGNTASSAWHTGDLDYFASLGYHAVSPDYLGTGLSDRLPSPWPQDWFQRNAADCVALIEYLNAENAIVVGTSGGSIVALWMAILYPQRVRAVIADSEGYFYRSGMVAAQVSDRAQRTPGQVRFWSKAHGEDWSQVVDADTALLLALEEAGRPGGGWDIYEGRLAEIRCPVMFSCSLSDSLIPEVGSQMLAMSQKLPGSWFFSVNQGFHPLMWSQPQAFRAAAQAFLNKVSK